jgi:serine/threonine protein kinase
MDRLTGPDLGRQLELEGPMAPDRAASLMAMVADAVDSVHQAGVIHGDLKPANIILDNGRPLVGDFGVARQLIDPQPAGRMDLTGGSAWIRTGDPSLASDPVSGDLGTVAYMPPEQWRGDGISAATDVYALGGTLFTLLTGRRPFERQTLPELAYAVAIVPAPRPSAFDVPRVFDDVVGMAMAKEPRDRFPTAAAFADAVRAAARGAKVAPPRRVRNVWPVITAVAALACLGLGAALLLVPYRSAVPDDLTVCAVDASVRDVPHGHTIALLHRGDHVSPLDARDGDAWVHVKLPDGRTGWSLTDFVRHSC